MCVALAPVLATASDMALAQATSGTIQVVLCYILDNFKLALAFASIVFVLLSWLSSRLDSEKLMDAAIGFAVGIVVIFALIYGVKQLGWANSLSCISAF
jgi:hypothetical protein